MKKYNFKRELAAEVFPLEDPNALTMSVASSAPYLRKDKNDKPFYEILVINDDSVDFERLIDGRCPFLMDHNTEKQIGVCEKAWIEDERLKATIRFSKNRFPQDILSDMKDGIRRNVSIGYSVDAYHMEKMSEFDYPVMFVDRFTIYEISQVACPADPYVGVERSLENVDDEMDTEDKGCDKTPEEEKSCDPASSKEEKKKDEQTDEDPPTEGCEKTCADDDEEAKASKKKVCGEEKACGEDEEDKATSLDCKKDPSTCEEDKKKAAEVAEIRSLGELTNQIDLAENFIKENRSLDEFKTELKNLKTENRLNVKKEDTTTMEKKFNILDALNAIDSRSGEIYEASYELKKSFDIPLNSDSYCFDIRALSTDDAALRPAEYKEELYTGLLYPESVIGKTGATIINFNRPQRAIKFAVQLSGAAASFVGLNAPVTSGNMGWTEKLYEPHKVGSYVNVPFTSYLEDQPDIQMIVTDDMLKNIYMSIDYSAITGTGTDNAPTGVINDADVNVVAPSGIYSLTGVMEFEKKIRDSNDFSNELTWVMNNEDYFKFATTPYHASEQNRMLLEDGKMIGYKVVICNGLTTGNVILGNFSQLLILNFHPVTLDVDTRGDGAALSQSRRYIVYAAIDVCVRRPKSFTVSRSA